jgi:hypothetical protein
VQGGGDFRPQRARKPWRQPFPRSNRKPLIPFGRQAVTRLTCTVKGNGVMARGKETIPFGCQPDRDQSSQFNDIEKESSEPSEILGQNA